MSQTFYFYFILGLIFIACSSDTKQASTIQSDGKVSLVIFDQELKKNKTPQLIDVRTPEEFAKGYVEGAKNINFNAANFESQISQLDKNQPAFIYCQSGGRSGKAYKKMKAWGFTKVYDMEGGYSAYSRKE